MNFLKKYVGRTRKIDVLNPITFKKNEFELINGDSYELGYYDNVEFILTPKGDIICPTDSMFYFSQFKIEW